MAGRQAYSGEIPSRDNRSGVGWFILGIYGMRRRLFGSRDVDQVHDVHLLPVVIDVLSDHDQVLSRYATTNFCIYSPFDVILSVASILNSGSAEQV